MALLSWPDVNLLNLRRKQFVRACLSHSIPSVFISPGKVQDLTVAAILPCNDFFLYSINHVKYALEICVEKIRNSSLLPNHRIKFFFADSGPTIYFPIKHVNE